ncbi:MAG: helix-turn-helix domain-containing protein [Proteobacteria bacterium]|nr:helix-turn-helix domain-containing protein [Pseudomonadota bacterium]
MRRGAKSTFARRLREARERVGFTQYQLGIAAGMDPAVASPRMNQYERGVHEPRLDTVRKLAKALGIPPALLYTEDDQLADLLQLWAQMSPTKRQKLVKLAQAEQGTPSKSVPRKRPTKR